MPPQTSFVGWHGNQSGRDSSGRISKNMPEEQTPRPGPKVPPDNTVLGKRPSGPVHESVAKFLAGDAAGKFSGQSTELSSGPSGSPRANRARKQRAFKKVIEAMQKDNAANPEANASDKSVSDTFSDFIRKSRVEQEAAMERIRTSIQSRAVLLKPEVPQPQPIPAQTEPKPEKLP